MGDDDVSFPLQSISVASNVLFYIPSSVNVGEDCPVFDGLFEFCQLSTGGSVGKCFHPDGLSVFSFSQNSQVLLPLIDKLCADDETVSLSSGCREAKQAADGHCH